MTPGRTRARCVVRVCSALVALVLGVLVTMTGPPAWAHATLVTTSPIDGQTLEEPPTRVDFRFSEDMSAPAYVVVTAPDGTSVTNGDPVVEGLDVTQAVTTSQRGDYTMAYRAVSADGHPVTGQIQFTVSGGTDGTGTATAGSTPTSVEAGPDDPNTSTRTSPAAAAGPWSGHLVDVSVAAALFLLAGGLLVLSRRAT